MNQSKVLFIGLVWPEPTSSAAGKRILQLVEFFTRQAYEVCFCSAATRNENSFDFTTMSFGKTHKIKEVQIELNHISFNKFIKKLQPDVVVYDRFVTEEQFGWRVRQECPNSVQILDTEDLHFLRFAREYGYKKNEKANLHNDVAKREIASILRCDLSLIISTSEFEILHSTFHIPKSILLYLPFLEDLATSSTQSKYTFKKFEQRSDFVFIGNFLHAPNWETVKHLKQNIWPKIRKKLPTATLNIYGAYAEQKVFELSNRTDGFVVQGKAIDALEVIENARIMLAPIVFGAGLKGKFIEAMKVGTPIATTTVGAEAMFGSSSPGFVEDNWISFAEKSIELFQNKDEWEKAQKYGWKVLRKEFDRTKFERKFLKKITELQANLSFHRNLNFTGQILNLNQGNYLKYMSLWIEEKNKN